MQYDLFSVRVPFLMDMVGRNVQSKAIARAHSFRRSLFGVMAKSLRFFFFLRIRPNDPTELLLPIVRVRSKKLRLVFYRRATRYYSFLRSYLDDWRIIALHDCQQVDSTAAHLSQRQAFDEENFFAIVSTSVDLSVWFLVIELLFKVLFVVLQPIFAIESVFSLSVLMFKLSSFFLSCGN